MLDNLLGITDERTLADAEERLTKKRAMELWDQRLLDGATPGVFATLQYIHRHLFQDIYSFAGQVRTDNIAKNDFRFANALFLPTQLPVIGSMPDSTLPEIVDKYAEMNIAHPFREGNGRPMRLWLDHLVEDRLARRIDWSAIPHEEYMSAMIRSHVRTVELRVLLEENLTELSTQRHVFARTVNTSYAYEGYRSYDAGSL